MAGRLDKKQRRASLTAKQRRFVAEYLKDSNATQACIRAGYSAKGANVTGAQLLAIPSIRDAVAEATTRVLKRAELTAEDVVRELAHVGFSDVGKLFDKEGNLRPVHELPRSVRRSISSIEVEEHWEGRGEEAKPVTVRKIRFWSKVDALGMLAKKFGLLVDKHEHRVETTLADIVAASMRPKEQAP